MKWFREWNTIYYTGINKGELYDSEIMTNSVGRDIGVNLPLLLNAIVAELPLDGSTMLQIGMTNPPYILEHLKEIANVLRHPCVYSFLNVPVQSGSDSILTAMNWEYTMSKFKMVDDTLIGLVPGMRIATDIICGLLGTPAARMKNVPSTVVKKRSRDLTTVFESFTPFIGMEDKVERIWITEIAADGIHLVGHTKGYIQVLVTGPKSMLGTSAIARITSVAGWSVFGEVIKILNQQNDRDPCGRMGDHKYSSCSTIDSCACSKEPEPCCCETTGCCRQVEQEGAVSSTVINMKFTAQNSQSLIGWLLRKRKNYSDRKIENGFHWNLK